MGGVGWEVWVVGCSHKGFDAGEFDGAGGGLGCVAVIVVEGNGERFLGGRHHTERQEREHDLRDAQGERHHAERARVLAHTHGRRVVHSRRRGGRRCPLPLPVRMTPVVERLRLPLPSSRHPHNTLDTTQQLGQQGQQGQQLRLHLHLPQIHFNHKTIQERESTQRWNFENVSLETELGAYIGNAKFTVVCRG